MEWPWSGLGAVLGVNKDPDNHLSGKKARGEGQVIETTPIRHGVWSVDAWSLRGVLGSAISPSFPETLLCMSVCLVVCLDVCTYSGIAGCKLCLIATPYLPLPFSSPLQPATATRWPGGCLPGQSTHGHPPPVLCLAPRLTPVPR